MIGFAIDIIDAQILWREKSVHVKPAFPTHWASPYGALQHSPQFLRYIYVVRAATRVALRIYGVKKYIVLTRDSASLDKTGTMGVEVK